MLEYTGTRSTFKVARSTSSFHSRKVRENIVIYMLDYARTPRAVAIARTTPSFHGDHGAHWAPGQLSFHDIPALFDSPPQKALVTNNYIRKILLDNCQSHSLCVRRQGYNILDSAVEYLNQVAQHRAFTPHLRGNSVSAASRGIIQARPPHRLIAGPAWSQHQRMSSCRWLSPFYNL